MKTKLHSSFCILPSSFPFALVSVLAFCLAALPAPALVDHFAWSTITSPQCVNAPFGVSITAKNSANATVTDFGAVAALRNRATIT